MTATDTELTPGLRVDAAGWRLTESGYDKDRAVAVGSNLLCGNGYVGYRGTSAEQRAEDYVAFVVSDTFDCADGVWRELTTAPNPLLVAASVAGVELGIAHGSEVETSLDMQTGQFGCTWYQHAGGATISVEIERFASYDELHLVAQRWVLRTDQPISASIEHGIDGDVWSLNGVHLPILESAVRGAGLSMAGRTSESDVLVAVAAAARVGGTVPSDPVDRTDRSITWRSNCEVTPDQPLVIESFGAVFNSNDVADPEGRATAVALDCCGQGFDAVRAASRDRWREIWVAMDVQISGDRVDQTGVRFAAYHNRLATPAHTDHMPIGARGLSCQAYQGAAFWDQEVYNLPAFLYTEPEIARSILAYRHRTLDGARRKAARLGYDGAYFAWISGETGDELCPDYFFKDVLTDRPIRNHFNVWQIHVAPDIVTTLARYVEITGDERFLVEQGAEIAFEVARFLRSFVRYDEWRDVYHNIRLLGPDEWHENVDNNAFTNYQTKRALDFAVQTHEFLAVEHPEELRDLSRRLELDVTEVDGWRRVSDKMLLPQPDPTTRLIEQFDGFFDLEDVMPDQVRTRLLHPQEYWGWPNGVAVATQVSKQADVAVLLWLHSRRFDTDVLRANYEYYEPRCSHDSSLSHAAFGMVAIAMGDLDRAHHHFRKTASVDLLDENHAVVGGTFIGGIHTAACGGTYQLAVQGFGGLGFADGRLVVDPAVPARWGTLTYPIRWRGQTLRVSAGSSSVEVTASSGNTSTVPVVVRGREVQVGPGEVVAG